MKKNILLFLLTLTSLTTFSQNTTKIENLLNTELDKQIASKEKYGSDELVIVEKFKIDKNNILSFSIKETYKNVCYPNDLHCRLKDFYRIDKQEVALSDIKRIWKDGKVFIETKGENDVKYSSKIYTLDGKLYHEKDPSHGDLFNTQLFMRNNEEFGNEFVELMKNAGFSIEKAVWHPK